MASDHISIALGRQKHGLELDELAQARLLLRVGVVAAGRADEADVLHLGLLGRADELEGDVALVLVGGRNQAEGVAARVLKGLSRVALAAGLVGDDLGTELLGRLGTVRGWVQDQGHDGVDFAREELAEQELDDGKAGMAISGGNTNLS